MRRLRPVFRARSAVQRAPLQIGIPEPGRRPSIWTGGLLQRSSGVQCLAQAGRLVRLWHGHGGRAAVCVLAIRRAGDSLHITDGYNFRRNEPAHRADNPMSAHSSERSHCDEPRSRPPEPETARPDHTAAPTRRRRRWLLPVAVLRHRGAGRGRLVLRGRRPPTRPAGPAPRPAARQRRARRSVLAAACRSSRRQPGKGSIDVYLNALGTVTPRNTVTVQAARRRPADAASLFREGQMVKAGELLAEIDPRPFQVQLDAGQGQLAQATRRCSTNAQRRPRALPDAARAGFDRQAAGRHAGGAGAPVRGHGRRPTRARSTTPSCSSPTRASPRRSAAASACARSTRQHRARRPTPTASS